MQGHRSVSVTVILAALVVLLLAADPALAYIGPGAGLELAGYFMALLATVGVALLSTLLYPVYAMIHFLRGAWSPPNPEPAAKMPAFPPTASSADNAAATAE